MLSFSGGTAMELDAVVHGINVSAAEHAIEGITLLGGEPFAHSKAVSMLARQAQARGLSVMVFSGFAIEVLRARCDPHVSRLLDHTDILVDGPYQREMPDRTRRWIGSSNQRIHFLSNRYQPSDDCWNQSDTLEIRLSDGEVMINGFPAKQAASVWRRPK
jgi:anaerobic ribonucleoside-triphosphate reductase activating protein